MKPRKSKTSADITATKEAAPNTPEVTPEAVSADNAGDKLVDEPEAVTPEAVAAQETKAEAESSQEAEHAPEETQEALSLADVPFSRLSKIGKYITLLEMYDGDYPRGSKMSEFLTYLRPLAFEVQLSENVKDNKELRDNVLLPCGAKGYKALQDSIKHLEARVAELYEDILNDVFPDEAAPDEE